MKMWMIVGFLYTGVFFTLVAVGWVVLGPEKKWGGNWDYNREKEVGETKSSKKEH
jgi:hypothetical protein